MPTDIETRTIQEYVLSNAVHVEIAKAVHEAWPSIEKRICKRFLQQLQSRIYRKIQKNHADFSSGITIDGEFTFGSKTGSGLWLYRDAWAPVGENHPSKLRLRRTSVRLHVVQNESHDVWLGVESPHWNNQNADAAEEVPYRMDVSLADKLGYEKKEDYYPWWKDASEKYRLWGDLLPELHRECENKHGEITDYFVKTFLGIAVSAIPIIDKMEDSRP